MPSDPSPVVTGTMLRDLAVCERRAWHDVHAPEELRDPTASFVQLLWAEGLARERDVLGALVGAVDLRGEAPGDRRRLTGRALADPEALHVLGGEIAHGDLVGRPDLISRVGAAWVAGDVKAGLPLMPDGRRVKREYGVQIGLYARVLDETGLGDGDRGFVIGADGGRVLFDMGAPWGGTTMRRIVDDLVDVARSIQAGVARTRGEASAKCGLCHWRTLCRGELERADDLTLIAELGRKARGQIEVVAPSRTDLAHLDVDGVATARGGTRVAGVGAERLRRFQDRARLQLTPGAKAYAREPLGLERAPLEWHLDIEADPTRDGLVYLHGVWERVRTPERTASRFVHFFADGADGEREAFAAAWAFLTSDPTARVYYYSRYERTAYRALQKRHPDVCTAAELEAFFADPRVVDLYTDVVRPRTEWPLGSYGIKPIAKSLGFFWAAEDASGASSIAWYDEFARTGDADLRAKIIDYNRSDCIASAVVLDALIALPVGPSPWPPQPHQQEQEQEQEQEQGPLESLAVEFKWEGGDRDDVPPLDEGGAVPAPIARRVPPRATPADATAAPTLTDREETADGAEGGAGFYHVPTLRVCAAPCSDWNDGDLCRAGRALTTDLPLAGASAFAPTADGGFALAERLRGIAPWLEPAIAVVERSLRIGSWAGRPWLALPAMLLVGGPGTGKSFFARALAGAAHVPCGATDLGAASDALNFAGVARGWSSAIPCWPAREIAALGVANPVLVGDELDKSGGHRRSGGGTVHDAVLNMIERSTARSYNDRCLLSDLDLSAVNWVFTANDLADIPAPLISRLEVVKVTGPGPEHFDALMAAIEAELVAGWALPAGVLRPLPPSVVRSLRDLFARRRSARELRFALRRLHEAAVPPRPEVLH